MPEQVLVPIMGAPITPNGAASIQFHTWLDAVTNAVNNMHPLTGTGTPEGNIVAFVGRWYVDTSAAVGTGIYFKQTGDGDTGWVLRS